MLNGIGCRGCLKLHQPDPFLRRWLPYDENRLLISIDIGKSGMYSLTLRFKNKEQEQAFMDATLARTRLQGQVALLIGMFVYILHGMLDQWFVSPDLQQQVWFARATALCVPAAVLLVSVTPYFSRIRHLLLALVGLAAGGGLVGMQIGLPLESAPYFYPMMVLVTFYTYNFVGTRFIYALCVDLLLLLVYNLIFGSLLEYPKHVLLGHDFFIVSANRRRCRLSQRAAATAAVSART